MLCRRMKEKIEPKGKEAAIQEIEDEDVPAYQEIVLFYLATGIKTLLIAWCITIISLAYIKLPDSKWWVADQRIDATYAAGVLGGLLGSLGVTVANAGKKKDEKNGSASGKKEIAELKAVIEELKNSQIVRIQTPLKIIPTQGVEVETPSKPKEPTP